jgi:hypothetical protein
VYDPLTTVDQVKAWLKSSGTGDDALIEALIPTSSELIGRYCERENLGSIYSYSEVYYPGQRARSWHTRNWDIVLRHYPVVSLTSVIINNTQIPILQQSDLQAGTSGVYLEEDTEPRVLKFIGVAAYPVGGFVQVNYTAGYPSNAIPAGLSQGTNQFTVEMLRASTRVGLKSVSAAGETTSFDMGTNWAMSSMVKAMVHPYRNVMSFGAR